MNRAKTVKTAGIEFSYREFGSADGTPGLLLHGFSDAVDAWDGLVDCLLARKRRLRPLALSMRGFGDTSVRQADPLSGQAAALVHDGLTFADALGLTTFVVLGHDWGARAPDSP